MGQFRDKIRESGHYQGAEEAATQTQQRATSPAQAVAPVISLEKTDVQMWADVLTVVLLFLIWRELVRQGGGR